MISKNENNYIFQKKNHLNYTEKTQFLHVPDTLSLKQRQTRANSIPITLPLITFLEKVYFRSQILEPSSIGDTGKFLVYQYFLKMWYWRSLERAGCIQKQTILQNVKMVQYWPILVYQYLGLEVYFFHIFSFTFQENSTNKNLHIP